MIRLLLLIWPYTGKARLYFYRFNDNIKISLKKSGGNTNEK